MYPLKTWLVICVPFEACSLLMVFADPYVICRAKLRCTLQIHIGGKIVRGSQVEYVNGVRAESRLDPDKYTYYDLMQTISDVGYTSARSELNPRSSEVSVYYLRPNSDMNDGLMPLNSHDDMLDAFRAYFGLGLSIIDVYVHCPHEYDTDEEDGNVHFAHENDSEEELIAVNNDVDPSCLTELTGELPVNSGGEHGEVDERIAEECGDEDGPGVGDMGEGSSDSDGGEWVPYDDSSSSCASLSGVDESSDDDEEENIPLVGLGVNVRNEGVEDSSDSDENTLVECGDDGRPIFPEFKDSYLGNPQLIEGMKFPNVQVFRKLLREYHIKEGYTFTFLKNESKRVTVVCARKKETRCPFRLHASPMYEEKSFQIKKINHMHTCTRVYTNNNATSSWLSEKYLPKLSDAPETKVASMKRTVRREWLLNVSKFKIYRAKRKALGLIMGDHKKQYLRLWDYCEMVRLQNPGSMAKLKVERPSNAPNPLFQRMFISYDAQVKGFLSGCRPIVGLDACFLKGPFGGQLMHAVARDGNNQMFPLAFAIVEAELKDSWDWFLENLITLIGDPTERGWCFVSDRQKVCLVLDSLLHIMYLII